MFVRATSNIAGVDVVELLPELIMFAFPIGQVYLWRDTPGLTLVDTGVPGSAAAVEDGLRQIGHRPDEVRRVLLTHFHQDHVGSAAEIVRWAPGPK